MPRSFKYGWAHVASPVVSDLCLGLTSTTSEKQSTDSRCCELRSNARRLVLSDDASLDVRDNFLVRLLLSKRLRLLLGEPVLLLQLVLSRARILSLSASSSTCCVLNEASHVFGVVGVSGMTVRERARHDHKYVPVRHGTTK